MSPRPNDGGPAFPTPGYQQDRADGPETWTENVASVEGMSLRDYLAAKAMAALVVSQAQLAACDITRGVRPSDVQAESAKAIAQTAEAAYRLADLMIAARGRE